MFKRVVTGIGAFLLIAAPFSSAQAALLAKVEADVDGSGQKKMVELTGDKSPRELQKKLLAKHNILIKDLSSKTDGGHYLRLAIRNEEDNDRLIIALKEEL